MEGKVTVIVPAFNEAKNMRRVLGPLIDWQKMDPEKREVVVVNDGSTDGTGKIAEKYFKMAIPKGGWKVIHSDPPAHKNLGKAEAFIAGAFEAKRNGSEILVTLDADLFDVTPQKIAQLVFDLRHSEKDMILAIVREVGDFWALPKEKAGQRAIKLNMLEPLFNNSPKWRELMKGFALEEALNYLIRKVGISSVKFEADYAFRKSKVDQQMRDSVKLREKIENRRSMARGAAKIMMLPDLLEKGTHEFTVGELSKGKELQALLEKWGYPRGVKYSQWRKKVAEARKWLRSQQRNKPHLRSKY